MGKVLIGTDLGTYTFDKVAKTVTISNIDVSFNIEEILGIVNVKNGVNIPIYSPLDHAKGGTILNNVITLDYDTSTMANTDPLEIWVNYSKKKEIVEFKDDSMVTISNRLRVSNSKSIYDGMFEYGLKSQWWDSILVGLGSTITHNINESGLLLNIGAVANARTTFQSRVYIPYQAGTSPIIRETFVLSPPKLNVIQEIGLFDDFNGFFLREENGVISLVKRDSLTGTAVDVVYPRSTWIDKLDGTGKSKITLNFTLSQHLVIDFLALKVGVFRVNFLTKNGMVKVLEENYTNSLGSSYLPTASLPIRFQIRTGAVAPATPSTMKNICCNYESENGDPIRETLGERFVIDDGGIGKLVALGIETPIISIRPKLLHNAKTFRGLCILEDINLFSLNEEYKFIIRKNGILTGAIWAPSLDLESAIEIDTSATIITGGRIVAAGTSDKKSKTDLSKSFDKEILSINAAGTIADTLTISAYTLFAADTFRYTLTTKEIK